MDYFTSDLHLFHKNIIEFQRSSWAKDVKSMHEAIHDRWNAVVKPEDRVWILGDVSFGNREATVGMLYQLNGFKHIIPGNHDHSRVLKRIEESLAAEVHPPLMEVPIREGLNAVLCHFPLAVWNRRHYGWWCLHGHSHGKYNAPGKILDVGIDCHPDHRPWTVEEIELAIVNKKITKIIDESHLPK